MRACVCVGVCCQFLLLPACARTHTPHACRLAQKKQHVLKIVLLAGNLLSVYQFPVANWSIVTFTVLANRGACVHPCANTTVELRLHFCRYLQRFWWASTTCLSLIRRSSICACGQAAILALRTTQTQTQTHTHTHTPTHA